MTNIPSSAKLQKSPETPNKPSDKPASLLCPSGLNLLFPDPLKIHRPQKIGEGMKKDTTEEETVLDSEIDEFDIEEMTEKFRKWMITNRDRFLVDFENPKGKLKQDEKSFNIRFHDDYSFKIVLED